MATTKRAQYQFLVKEGIDGPFIVAERHGRESESEYPLNDSEHLSFDLREGISLDGAQQIADFLNERLLYVAITRFGDVDDAARDVKQSERVQRIDLERFSSVVTSLKGALHANDVPAAIECMRPVEFVIVDLIREWSKAIAMSKAILDAFGEGGDHDAA